MFAQRKHFDVFHYNHLFVIFIKHCVIYNVFKTKHIKSIIQLSIVYVIGYWVHLKYVKSCDMYISA